MKLRIGLTSTADRGTSLLPLAGEFGLEGVVLPCINVNMISGGAGAFAASAYGKLTGKPAACFSIAGPGATNMFTGLWDAKVDRAPILALTGQVATQVVGTGNFQEVDLVRAFQTVADFNHRVQADSKHAELMSLAVKHALLNRDVSHLTFPDEIQVSQSSGVRSNTRFTSGILREDIR